MSCRESGLLEIRNGISDVTRMVLDKMRRKEMRDGSLDSDRPHVELGVRRALWRLEPGLVAIWELQPHGEHRWHLKKHWTLGRTDIPTHFMLLQSPSQGYVPLDGRAVELVEQALIFSRDPVEVVKRYLIEEEMKNIDDKEELYNDCVDWWKYYRRLFARSAWGTVGNLWERGIELPYEVTPKKAEAA